MTVTFSNLASVFVAARLLYSCRSLSLFSESKLNGWTWVGAVLGSFAGQNGFLWSTCAGLALNFSWLTGRSDRRVVSLADRFKTFGVTGTVFFGGSWGRLLIGTLFERTSFGARFSLCIVLPLVGTVGWECGCVATAITSLAGTGLGGAGKTFSDGSCRGENLSGE